MNAVPSVPPDKDPYPGQCWCQPGTVVMLMSGCGGDITDLARLRSSLITRLCLQIIIKLSPLATTSTSEEADTVRHHQPDLSLEIIAGCEETDPARLSDISGNKTGEMATLSCLHLTSNYYLSSSPCDEAMLVPIRQFHAPD